QRSGDPRRTRCRYPRRLRGAVRPEPRPVGGAARRGRRILTIRTVFADDEKLAREEIGYLLHSVEDIAVVGEASNGVDAFHLIETERPDLALLDIEMPGLDGFQLAREVQALESPPQVVFVTAYDRYALQAFEVSALDYLMKPVSRDRLQHAIDRVRGS